MAKENLDIVNPNPLVDTGEVTTEAYIKLKDKGLVTSTNPNKILGETDTQWYTSPNFKAQVYVYTPLDKQYHRYWTSMNIDVQVQDFMGTCELHAPYDSDLMAYWQPIAQICIVYGSNNGPAKVLFVGRVREVKQDGYECVVTLQNYGWKFQQDAPAKFVEDNVTNKDGYTILLNIFEILKIKGYTISDNAKKRLKEVGINSDGNLTLNGKEIEEMPDLLDRLKALNKADMTTIMGKKTITEKEREDQISWSDVYNLNYTLRYSEPTATMTKLNNSSNYTAGNTVYKNNYSKAGTSSASSTTTPKSAPTPGAKPTSVTSSATDATAIKAFLRKSFKKYAWIKNDNALNAMYWFYRIWHGGVDPWAPSIAKAEEKMKNYIKAHSKEKTNIRNCLNTMQKGATKNKDWYPDVGITPQQGYTGSLGSAASVLGNIFHL